MDEFDYLNGTLEEWVALQTPHPENYTAAAIVRTIQDFYLPSFEAALHRNAVKALSGNVL